MKFAKYLRTLFYRTHPEVVFKYIFSFELYSVISTVFIAIFESMYLFAGECIEFPNLKKTYQVVL